MENLDEELDWKLRGYFNMPRELFNELAKGKITPDQLLLLSVYIALATWDDRHKDYAETNISNRKIARIMSWNKDKVGLNKGLLFGRGYIDLLQGKNRQIKVRIKKPESFFTKITDKVSENKSTTSKCKPT